MNTMRIFKSHDNSYTAGRKDSIKYITVFHSGNFGDTAKMNARFFNKRVKENKVSYHYFVDDKEIINSVDDSDTAYFLGDSLLYKDFIHDTCRNENSLSIILCGIKDKDGKNNFINIEDNFKMILNKLASKYNIPDENILRFSEVNGKEERSIMCKEFNEFMKKLKEEM